MTDNVQTPGGNTTTAGAVEQLRIASRIASAALQENETFPVTAGGILALAQASALAAIIETTEAAAKLAERNSRPTYSMTLPPIKLSDGPGDLIATALRNNDHLKGPKP